MRLEFDPHEDTAFNDAVDRLVDAFESAVGHDGWVAHQLLHQRRDFLDSRLTHWVRADLAELLIEVFPRKVLVEEDDIDTVVPITRSFLRWLHDTHGLTGEPLPRLLHALDQMGPEVAVALRDPRRFGPAKSLATMMSQADVDLEDPGAIGDFMASFNARPFEERTDLLPLPGDPGMFDLPPLPPLRPLSPEQMAAAAEDAPLFRWVRGFVAGIGEGLALTKTGNLRLADGRRLAAALNLDDVDRRQELGGSLRSTADLPNLDLTFRVARAAGFVKVQRGKVSPTKRASDLTDDPARAWPRTVEGLLDVGILAHHYEGRSYFVPPWVDHLDHSLDGLLMSLYLVGDPMPIDALVEVAREDLGRIWEIPEPTDDRSPMGTSIWWEKPDRDVRHLLHRLTEAGVVDVADVEQVPVRVGVHDMGHRASGGTAMLTPAGRVVTADLARRAGLDVAEAGRLRDADATDLLVALAGTDFTESQPEIEVWIDARGPAAALESLVGAVRGGLPRAVMPVCAQAVLNCASALGTAAAEPLLRPLLDDRVLGPMIGGWLIEHGVPDVPHATPLDVLVSMAALGAADEAVLTLQDSGSVPQQQALIDTARTEMGQDAIPLLNAIADLHPDKAVAKAARKALFRLGVRR
ncbi:hypothetical protein BH23ACT9_BH23ACT9_31460 [soil metagenome]